MHLFVSSPYQLPNNLETEVKYRIIHLPVFSLISSYDLISDANVIGLYIKVFTKLITLTCVT